MPNLKMVMPMPGGAHIEIMGDGEKDMFRRAAFWHSIPDRCPVDGSDVKFDVRTPSGYEYFSVVSTGEVRYEFKFGQHQEGNTLFPSGKWTYYNPDVVGQDGKKGVEIVVWEYGRLYEDRLPQGPVRQVSPRQQEQAMGGPGQGAPQQGQQQGQQGQGGYQRSPEQRQAQDLPFRSAPQGRGSQEDQDKLARGLAWVNDEMNKAQVPEPLKPAILTNMLNKPVQSVSRLEMDDVREIVNITKETPNVFTLLLEDAQNQEKAGQGEFPPEEDLPF